MSDFQWILHKGKRIIYAEMGGKSTEEILESMARAKVEIRKEPLESVLSLINVKGGKICTEINQAFKDLAKDTDPNMKMTAIIGLEGLQTIMLNGVLMFTRTKKVAVKNSKEEALDFLAGL
jgi:hypothetical protein